MTNSDCPEDFRRVADWCREYLSVRHSPEAATSFASLIEAFGEISSLTRPGGADRFDGLKGLETRVNALLADVSASWSEAVSRRASGAARSGATPTTLFVYGTLKRGYSRSPALHSQKLIGEAATAPRYRMFDCGGYPGLVESADGLRIQGELWEVDADCLAALDEIEGVELHLYRRAPILLEAPHAGLPCEAYLYARGTAGLRDCGTCW